MSKDLKREFIGGLTTFLTMSYIIIVNPSILGTPGTGMGLKLDLKMQESFRPTQLL